MSGKQVRLSHMEEIAKRLGKTPEEWYEEALWLVERGLGRFLEIVEEIVEPDVWAQIAAKVKGDELLASIDARFTGRENELSARYLEDVVLASETERMKVATWVSRQQKVEDGGREMSP